MREALTAEADRRIEALRSGESSAIDWQPAETLSRQDDTGLAQPVVDAVFRLPHPEGDETVYGRAVDGQRVVLIALDEVSDGQVDEQSEAYVARMAQQLRARQPSTACLATCVSRQTSSGSDGTCSRRIMKKGPWPLFHCWPLDS